MRNNVIPDTEGMRVTKMLVENVWPGQRFLHHGTKYEIMTEEEIKDNVNREDAPIDLLSAVASQLRRNGKTAIAFVVGTYNVVAFAYGTEVLALIPRRVRRRRVQPEGETHVADGNA